MVRSVARNPDSRGLVGSDRLDEMQFDGYKESVGIVMNDRQQALRFALIAQNADRCRAKLRAGEGLRLATSYPRSAMRRFPDFEFMYASGGIEAELLDQGAGLDAAYELVQSGDSVRDNGLEIVEDCIEFVELVDISLNLANNR